MRLYMVTSLMYLKMMNKIIKIVTRGQFHKPIDARMLAQSVLQIKRLPTLPVHTSGSSAKLLHFMLYSRGGQTFLSTGRISFKYCIAGRKHFLARFLYLFLKKFHIIDVNLGYFPNINVS
jgi:hypothetical protein